MVPDAAHVDAQNLEKRRDMLAAGARAHQRRVEDVSCTADEGAGILVVDKALPLGHVARRVGVVEMADGQSRLH